MMDAYTSACVLVIAFLGDVLLGDPPNRIHPVAWMGNTIAVFRRVLRFNSPIGQFASGLVLVVTGTAVLGGTGWIIERLCIELPPVISIVVQAIVLKCTFTARSLAKAASTVQSALANNDIPLARHEVAYHLVSRDTSSLGSSELAAATIESVAENTSDSIVAPLFFFAVFGLPGALAYRFVNTCDAMLGYRTQELEWFGKASARFDDLLNLIPARLTALVMLTVGLGSAASRVTNVNAARIWWRDHSLTSSPNAGHPMSAAAGVLGVTLQKRDHYKLAMELPEPTSETISGAIKLLWATAVVTVLLFTGLLLLEPLP
jgi:adenosylcobinamide-phosphate synthase